MRTLPPEVIDHIFSCLQSEHTTLARCSRAHPFLYHLAERHIYADIVVLDNRSTMDDKDSRTFFATEFHTLLTDSPHIANYVHKLEIRLSLNRVDQAGDGIARVLPMLMRLSRISVTSEFEGYCQLQHLPAEFFDAFVKRLSSPLSVLKEVSIGSVSNTPLRIFDGCTTVKSILLYGFADKNNLVRPRPQPQVLDSLALRSWDDRDLTFLTWARERIHSLRSLYLHSNPSDITNKLLQELIGMCSSSLTHLQLHIFNSYAENSFLPAIDLSSLQHLIDLTMGANLSPWYSERALCMHSFHPMIQVLQTSPYLDNLTLKFYIDFLYDESMSDFIDWSPLLSFLSRSSAKFRHIGLRISLNVLRTRQVVASADTLPQLYHSEIVADMMAKGILDISSEQYSIDDFAVA